MTTNKVQKRIKYRTVAKQWRETEGSLIKQMSEWLPYPATLKSRLNKLDVVRLVRTLLHSQTLEAELGGSLKALGEANQVADALNCFLLSVDHTGLILHASEHVYNFLGHPSLSMIGCNISEYLHPEDFKIFFSQFQTHKRSNCSPYTGAANGMIAEDRCFNVRMNYRIIETHNRVKQTGFVGLHCKGVLKYVPHSPSRQQRSILVVAFYLNCLTICTELRNFNATYVLRIDKNDRLAYIEDWIYDGWGVKRRPYVGDNVKLAMHPADVEGMFSGPLALCRERGSMVMCYQVVTRNGYMFQAVSHDNILFDDKGDMLFHISARYVDREKRVRIKKWLTKIDFLIFCTGYCVPGEDLVPFQSHIEDITDFDVSHVKYLSVDESYKYITPSAASADMLQGESDGTTCISVHKSSPPANNWSNQEVLPGGTFDFGADTSSSGGSDYAESVVFQPDDEVALLDSLQKPVMYEMDLDKSTSLPGNLENLEVWKSHPEVSKYNNCDPFQHMRDSETELGFPLAVYNKEPDMLGFMQATETVSANFAQHSLSPPNPQNTPTFAETDKEKRNFFGLLHDKTEDLCSELPKDILEFVTENTYMFHSN